MMTSTQEPNTTTPQTAVCICLRKLRTKLIVPIYFETKMPKLCLKFFFLRLDSELSFEWGDAKIDFDRARCTTVNSLLRALRTICNIWSNDKGDFANELLVYQEWIARNELVEKQVNEKHYKHSCMVDMFWVVISSPKHKITMSVYGPFTMICL